MTTGRAGKERQYERLARRFYARIYSYLRWLCRGQHLAEDLTQQTFVQIWRHPPQPRGDRPLRAWVYRIARNEFLQHRRGAGFETITLGDHDDAYEGHGDCPDPQIRLEQKDLCQAVQSALHRLPELYREVIVLHNMESLPLSGVAQVLGVPEGTVKSRRAKAFALLRNMLADEVDPKPMRSSSSPEVG